MGFQLKGTTQPVRKVAANLDDVRPGKGSTVKVEAKKDKKKNGKA